MGGKKKTQFQGNRQFLKKERKITEWWKTEWRDGERKVEEEERRSKKQEGAVGIPDTMIDRWGVCVCACVLQQYT